MWTIENRSRYNRDGLRYPSDLSDAEWSHIAGLIPPGKRGGGKRRVDLREVMNGIMYVLSTGCQWRAIPKDLPPRSTLFDYLDLWSWDGTLERIHHALYVECRENGEREASPTAAIIDSQSVKSAEKGGRRLIRMVTMQERRSRARSATFSRHAWSVVERHRSFRRYSGSRWRSARSQQTHASSISFHPAHLRRRRLSRRARRLGGRPERRLDHRDCQAQ
jgi:transposase